MRPWLVFVLAVLGACHAPQAGSRAGGGGAGPEGAGGSGGTSSHYYDCLGGNGPDADGDGYVSAICGGPDCDDGDATVHPAARELCKDGIDQNCDGQKDEGCGCSAGEMRPCWGKGPAQENIGACRDGYQRCDAWGAWSACTGEVDPTPEPAACDGIDQDCDGADGAACAGCLDHEICGNGIDDDCDGTADNPEVCSITCQPSETALPDTLACCSVGTRFTYFCGDAPGLASCMSGDRVCLDLDGDPATHCKKECTGDTCVCGRPEAPHPAEVPDCGFETLCDRLGCEGRTGQNCYLGPPATLGKGVCHAGRTSCADGKWGSCDGQVTPGKEVCGNGLDDDCDGLVDEDDGTGHRCLRTDCDTVEYCDNGYDDDCDGFVDEGCEATEPEQACYSGSIRTVDHGPCKAGVQKRQDDGHWGPCLGEVVPVVERCGDDRDTDCNDAGGPGELEDLGCCTPTGDEICNGKDDDCDGLVDEDLMTSCGSCAMSCPASLAITDLDGCTGPGRACDRLQPASGGGITIDLSAQKPDHGIYFVNGGIRRFNTATGATDWDAYPGGTGSGAYAASPDGSLWVDAWNGSSGNIVHYGAAGQVACVFPYPSTQPTLALAADETGAAWVVFGDDLSASLYKLPADSHFGTTCLAARIGDQSDGLLLNAHLLASIVTGPPGLLWLTPAAGTSGLRIDRSTMQQTAVQMDPQHAFDRPVVDEAGHLWFSTANLAIVDVAPDDDGTHAVHHPLLRFPAFTGSGDGRLWGRMTSGFLGYLDLATGDEQAVTQSPDVDTLESLTTDDAGRIWMNARLTSGLRAEIRYDPSSGAWTTFEDQLPLLDNRDFLSQRSSAPLQRLEGPTGTFTQSIDGGSDRLLWTTVSWNADTPEGSSLAVTVRAASDSHRVEGAYPCGPFTASPADLAGCLTGSPRGRYMEIQVAFRGATSGTPTLRSLDVGYERP